MTAIRVVIASNKRATRAVCLRVLKPEPEVRVVGEAQSGPEAIACLKLKPRVLLLDLDLSFGYGTTLLQVLRQRSPRTKVILLTGPSDAGLLDALSHGARGYLDKKAIRTFLPKAVRVVSAGEAWVPRKMVSKILDRLVRLTARTEKQS